MPYRNIRELPDAVRSHLPTHAQEIFMQAFNSAYAEYQDPDKKRNKNSSPEEVAFKVAWTAVKQKYKKSGDSWTPK